MKKKIEVSTDDNIADVIEKIKGELKSFGIRVWVTHNTKELKTGITLSNERTEEEIKQYRDEASKEAVKISEGYKREIYGNQEYTDEVERAIDQTIRESDR